MENPYPLRQSGHLSATSMKAYSSCEACGAYPRNFVGAPQPNFPVAQVYGTAAHKLMEMAGKYWWKVVKTTGKPLDLGDGRKFVQYGLFYVGQVLSEKWGARGPSDLVVPISWRSDRERDAVSETAYRQKLDEEKGKYRGLIYNALEAFRLWFTSPLNLVDMQFELDFSKKKIALHTNRGPINLHGQIDRVDFSPAGHYRVFDYKTGWIVKSYQNRMYIVEDLQMTIYHYVMEKLTGKPPAAMYIQPLEFSTKFLREFGSDSLRKRAISIPERSNPAYIEDVIKLGLDIWEMVEMIVNSHRFSRQEKEDWQPRSSYGKKAGFADSVKQSRFVPRIGDWCENCQYLKFCRDDHREDWIEHESRHQKTIPLEDSPIVQLLPIGVPDESGKLFPTAARRSLYISRPRKALRKAMIDSKNFVTKAKLAAALNKIVGMMKALGPCPCVQNDLFPIWILPYLPRINREHVSIAEVCKNCPHGGCPRSSLE